MIVAGWADGYRNNTFRTYAALSEAGTPVRLIAGPWSHMSAASALPGPHIDLVAEMARWFDRWLRGADTGIGASGDRPAASRRSSTSDVRRPTIARARRDRRRRRLARRDDLAVAAAVHVEHRLTGGVVAHRLRPDTGTAAWNSCAGTLPYGQPTDQRFADAASLPGTSRSPSRPSCSATRAGAAGRRRPAGRQRVRAAVRRGAGRHVDADHPRAPQPHARDGDGDPAAADARRVRRRRGRVGGDRVHRAARPPAPARPDRGGLAQRHRAAGAGDAHRRQRRERAAAARGDRPGRARPRRDPPPRPAAGRATTPRSPGGSPTTCWPGSPRRRSTTARRTTSPVPARAPTATPARSLWTDAPGSRPPRPPPAS